MVKLIQITKNIKQQNEIPITFVVKNDNEIVANVEDKYRCEISKADNSKGWAADTPVKVFCSCPDFQFRWAYVLYEHSTLLHPDSFVLEPPKKTNPGMKLGACKHLNAVARELLNNDKGKQ